MKPTEVAGKPQLLVKVMNPTEVAWKPQPPGSESGSGSRSGSESELKSESGCRTSLKRNLRNLAYIKRESIWDDADEEETQISRFLSKITLSFTGQKPTEVGGKPQPQFKVMKPGKPQPLVKVMNPTEVAGKPQPPGSESGLGSRSGSESELKSESRCRTSLKSSLRNLARLKDCGGVFISDGEGEEVEEEKYDPGKRTCFGKCMVCRRSYSHSTSCCPYLKKVPHKAILPPGVDRFCYCCDLRGGHPDRTDWIGYAEIRECTECGTFFDHWLDECPKVKLIKHCYVCGVSDDHWTDECPKSIVYPR